MPKRRDFLKRVLVVIRNWSHLGRGLVLGLVVIKGIGTGRGWCLLRVLVEIDGGLGAETDAAGGGVALTFEIGIIVVPARDGSVGRGGS